MLSWIGPEWPPRVDAPGLPDGVRMALQMGPHLELISEPIFDHFFAQKNQNFSRRFSVFFQFFFIFFQKFSKSEIFLAKNGNMVCTLLKGPFLDPHFWPFFRALKGVRTVQCAPF